jgi:hypothetical protein
MLSEGRDMGALRYVAPKSRSQRQRPAAPAHREATLVPAFTLLVALVALTGCAPSNGYVRASAGPHCWTTVPNAGEAVSKSIFLDRKLRAQLHSQLGSESLEQSECWYEEPNGQLKLVAGDGCETHKEFYFEKMGTAWKLSHMQTVEKPLCIS